MSFYVLNIHSFDVPCRELSLFDTEGNSVTAYDKYGKEKSLITDESGVCFIYVKNPGVFMIQVSGEQKYQKAYAHEIEMQFDPNWGAVIEGKAETRIVTEPPAEGTASNIISVILSE